ncbi:unnamed protein product [Closterium sp. NIES-54]
MARATATARAASPTTTPTPTPALAATLLCRCCGGGGMAKDFSFSGDDPLCNLSESVVLGEELHVCELVGIEGRGETLEEVVADDGVRVDNTQCCKAASKVEDAVGKGGCAGGGVRGEGPKFLDERIENGDSGEENGKSSTISNAPRSDVSGVGGEACGVGGELGLVFAVAGSSIVVGALVVLIVQLPAKLVVECGAVSTDGGLYALWVVVIRREGGRVTRRLGLGSGLVRSRRRHDGEAGEGAAAGDSEGAAAGAVEGAAAGAVEGAVAGAVDGAAAGAVEGAAAGAMEGGAAAAVENGVGRGAAAPRWSSAAARWPSAPALLSVRSSLVVVRPRRPRRRPSAPASSSSVRDGLVVRPRRPFAAASSSSVGDEWGVRDSCVQPVRGEVQGEVRR